MSFLSFLDKMSFFGFYGYFDSWSHIGHQKCHRLHRDLELIVTGAAIRKAKDIKILVHTTVFLIAQ